MEIGVLIGREVGLAEDDRTRLVEEAANLGYASAWTNSGPDLSSVEVCRHWWEAAHITTGTAVIPTPGMDLPALANVVRAFAEASDNRFILGVGAGNMDSPRWRETHPDDPSRPIGTMRQHIQYFKQHTPAPVYLAALGPRMLNLVGELADGALPNWMDPPQLAWARERITEGARKTGRDGAAIPIGQSIRVSVDDDPVAARRALAKSAANYSFWRQGESGGGHYRQNVTRMGLDAEMKRLEAMRDAGADPDAIADAWPDSVLARFGAWGRPHEALARLRTLADGLDLAIVRVVNARPGPESTRAIIQACAPTNWD